jgi:hypothetical protein
MQLTYTFAEIKMLTYGIKMNLKISENTINTPSYFHRDYKKDIDLKEKEAPSKVDSSWLGMIQRIAFASLPFFSLYKPFSFPLAMLMGSVRTLTSTSELFAMMQKKDAQGISMQMVQTGIAVASLAGTILAHPLGMLITTGQDTLLDAGHLVHALTEQDYKKAAERTLSLVNNTLYLGMFFAGSLELSIASLSVQVLLGLYHSADDFKNDRWIEGSAHLLMAGVRGNQLAEQVNTLQLRNEFERKLKTFIKQIKETQKKLSTDQVLVEEVLVNSVVMVGAGSILAKNAITTNGNPVDVNDNLEYAIQKFAQYKTLENAIKAKPSGPQDALIILKHHLCRPDDMGKMCMLALEQGSRTSLELVQLCLPSKSYLERNPKFIDDLYLLSLHHKSQPEVRHFLFDKEAVLHCFRRDQYFVDWFNYELRREGAFPGEKYMDFILRTKKDLGFYFFSKCPSEIKELHLQSSRWTPQEFWFHIHNIQRFDPSYGYNNKINAYEITLKYNLCSPVFYAEVLESNNKVWKDTFSYFLEDCYYWGHGDPRFNTYMKEFFPDRDYFDRHPEKLKAYLDDIVWKSCRSYGYTHPEIGINILTFLKNEGVNLKEIAQESKHPETIKFLKDNGLI